MKLSIIIPVYNEMENIADLLDKVLRVVLVRNIQKEIIVINDGSADESKELIHRFFGNHKAEFVYGEFSENQGKGAAVRLGITLASGEFIIVQDADLEYDPSEYNVLLEKLFQGDCQIVYGSRFLDKTRYSRPFPGHKAANLLMTRFCNALTGLKLTDMHTCYKLFRSELIKHIDIRENRFGFDTEITMKLAGIPGKRWSEVPVSYNGRSLRNKKITWKDGIRSFYCMIKYSF